MEKLIVALRSGSADDRLAERLCGPVAADLLTLDLPGVTVNVRDAPVRDSLMTLTTLDPPVAALVSLWAQAHYGEPVREALDLLAGEAESLAGYLVTESMPMGTSCSVGVGSYEDGDDVAAVTARADDALYRAKSLIEALNHGGMANRVSGTPIWLFRLPWVACRR